MAEEERIKLLNKKNEAKYNISKAQYAKRCIKYRHDVKVAANVLVSKGLILGFDTYSNMGTRYFMFQKNNCFVKNKDK